MGTLALTAHIGVIAFLEISKVGALAIDWEAQDQLIESFWAGPQFLASQGYGEFKTQRIVHATLNSFEEVQNLSIHLKDGLLFFLDK